MSNEEWLTYGQPADAIGESDMVFARRGDEFVLMPIELLGVDIVEEHEHVPGEIFLSGISADEGYFEITDALESIDIDKLFDQVEDESVYSRREAEVAVLGGLFDLSQDEIAAILDLSKNTVRNHIQAARDRWEKAQKTNNYTKP
ncbi:Sigma-70, region 4 [Haladaptatus litoreus]|uniref:Sigma-70, region 4 n=1 Tax=Haladaptatus litoreus TaxID=553468 RepID=A0A1N7FHJ3_9EURY|nr:sigma-70 region 4 domain-containing protein [Haladaptatus litoreus]SIR99898.1 Sigma-70, region 4 [Haladaptatus litoreus]